jgi:Zn-dependent protease
MPFRCNYCGGYYCAEHRLPEKHNCTGTYQYSRSTTGQTGFTPTGTTYNPRQAKRTVFWFSQKELKDLAIGLVVILAIPLFGIINRSYGNLNPLYVVSLLLAYASGFILHELAHKFAAQRYGYWAEFRINQQGLMLTLLSLISPFKVIAPGAVMIGGYMNWDDYGKISVAGPLTNIILALLGVIGLTFSGNGFIRTISYFGVLINSSLALFNLIPFGMFDGAKIMKWNWKIWLLCVVAAGGLYLFLY